MEQKQYKTNLGTICYWTNERKNGRTNLVFLPGLTADHRLFDKQIEHFESKANVLVWDAPGHAASRPFELTFSMKDKAIWLHEILTKEGFEKPVLVGQSMGGYISQMFMELFPGETGGFVCIDSASLQKCYTGNLTIRMLKHTEPIYRMYPWKTLLKEGAKGCAETEYGRKLMFDMMDVYSDNPEYYCKLVGHGYKMLADAIEVDRPYLITCPAVLICGEKDKAGYAKSYNKRWVKKTGLPMYWLSNAGHNSNSDKPEEVNIIIEEFIEKE